MATDDEKSQALETFLKDSLHALESLEKVQELEDADRGESHSEATMAASDKDKDSDTTCGSGAHEEEPNLLDRLAGYTGSAYKMARRTTGTSLKMGKKLMDSQDQLRMMLSAGESLRDLREVAGLTVNDLAESLNLKDKSLVEAVEDGTAALPFELILRLAAVLARNDPVPFILKYTRAYSPDTWRVLNDWGVGRLPLHFEREREFINIYRGHDEARELSDEGFKRVLEFTRQSFEMSLHFVAEEEQRLNEALNELDAERDAAEQEGREPAAPKRERRHRGQSQSKTTETPDTRKGSKNQGGKSGHKQSPNRPSGQ